MIYQSIADIYAANDSVRREFTARVENLSEAQQTFRPAEGAWSIAEIVDHLSITEQNMVQLIGILLKKSEGAAEAGINPGDGGGAAAAAAAAAGGDARTGAPAPAFQPFSLDNFLEQVRDVKLTAPERVRPGGNVTLADALTNLRRTRAAIDAMRPRLETSDLSAATYPHPAFGEFNSVQWLAFIGHHESRHLRQIENLMAAPEFGKSEGAG
ncbi:MAG: DinB family protein [Acidobacteria bacterium]|nr:DinB family protein [Acidobacteriota bacterium]